MSFNCRLACPEDETALKNLHRLCFEDSQEYVDFYFANRPPEYVSAVLCDEKKICAMMTAFPLTINRQKGAYLYAVGTHPDYRGQGCMRRLFRWMQEWLKEAGKEFCLLLPVNEKMEQTYRRMGFSEFMPLYREEVKGKENLSITALSFDAFVEQHRCWIQSKTNAVCWSDQALRYQYDEMCAFGGGAITYLCDGQWYYASYTRQGDTVYLLEDNGPNPSVSARAVATYSGAAKAQMRMSYTTAQGSRSPAVLAMSLTDAPLGEKMSTGYAAFLLDV